MVLKTEEMQSAPVFDSLTDAIIYAESALTKSGVEMPRFEAQLLLAMAMDAERAQIVARTLPAPNTEQTCKLEGFLTRRGNRIPLAYLRGTQEFYGLDFELNTGTLIPRPETEMLVDILREHFGANSGSGVFTDVGVGSGCISIAALVHLPQVQCIGVDISPLALEASQANGHRHCVHQRLRLVQASYLQCLTKVDFIVSNPPYIPSAEVVELQPEVRDHEPRAALDGGSDGLTAYRELAAHAERVLKPHGKIAVECGIGQADSIAKLFAAARLQNIRMQNDFAGIPRVVIGERV